MSVLWQVVARLISRELRERFMQQVQEGQGLEGVPEAAVMFSQEATLTSSALA